MSDRRVNLNLSLNHGEDFDREIEEMIKARVKEAVRSTAQAMVDETINDILPDLARKRVAQICDARTREIILNVAGNYTVNPDMRRVINDEVKELIKDRVDMDREVRIAAERYMKESLGHICPADVISAITTSILSYTSKHSE